ncbi:hypothetical protein IAT38_002573 [Cryptococcus sp. DSM 104549]
MPTEAAGTGKEIQKVAAKKRSMKFRIALDMTGMQDGGTSEVNAHEVADGESTVSPLTRSFNAVRGLVDELERWTAAKSSPDAKDVTIKTGMDLTARLERLQHIPADLGAALDLQCKDTPGLKICLGMLQLAIGEMSNHITARFAECPERAVKLEVATWSVASWWDQHDAGAQVPPVRVEVHPPPPPGGEVKAKEEDEFEDGRDVYQYYEEEVSGQPPGQYCPDAARAEQMKAPAPPLGARDTPSPKPDELKFFGTVAAQEAPKEFKDAKGRKADGAGGQKEEKNPAAVRVQQWKDTLASDLGDNPKDTNDGNDPTPATSPAQEKGVTPDQARAAQFLQDAGRLDPSPSASPTSPNPAAGLPAKPAGGPPPENRHTKLAPRPMARGTPAARPLPPIQPAPAQAGQKGLETIDETPGETAAVDGNKQAGTPQDEKRWDGEWEGQGRGGGKKDGRVDEKLEAEWQEWADKKPTGEKEKQPAAEWAARGRPVPSEILTSHAGWRPLPPGQPQPQAGNAGMDFQARARGNGLRVGDARQRQ